MATSQTTKRAARADLRAALLGAAEALRTPPGHPAPAPAPIKQSENSVHITTVPEKLRAGGGRSDSATPSTAGESAERPTAAAKRSPPPARGFALSAPQRPTQDNEVS